jgi:hypothetical protein
LVVWVKPVLEAIRNSGIPGAVALYITECFLPPVPEIPQAARPESLYDDYDLTAVITGSSIGDLSCGEPSYDLMGLDFPASADTMNMTGFDFMLDESLNTRQQQNDGWQYEQMGDTTARSR